jgi:hypothetical protein
MDPRVGVATVPLPLHELVYGACIAVSRCQAIAHSVQIAGVTAHPDLRRFFAHCLSMHFGLVCETLAAWAQHTPCTAPIIIYHHLPCFKQEQPNPREKLLPKHPEVIFKPVWASTAKPYKQGPDTAICRDTPLVARTRHTLG